ncbi:hypothetical protein TrST_g3722 [Triparma strigata]|nr:hypothetical protein TrST_g3722 [Triparma strigata]
MDGDSFEEAIEGVDGEVETLVLSELVFSYLNHESRRKLIDVVERKFKKGTMIFYEVLAEGEYAKNYSGQFTKKLGKGFECWKSKEEIEGCFARSQVEIVGASKAAFEALEGKEMKPMEFFDEYAALKLYLSCYVLVKARVGVGGGGDADCGTAKLNKSGLEMSRVSTLPSASLASLSDECKKIYTSTYSELSSKFKPVRKMVKNAVKNDLQKLAENFDEFWVAHLKGAGEGVAGFVGVKVIEESNTIEIKRLCVQEEFRGQGVGKALISSAVGWAKNRSGGWLWKVEATTIDALDGAMAVYLKSGFKKAGEVDLGGGVKLVTFDKELS